MHQLVRPLCLPLACLASAVAHPAFADDHTSQAAPKQTIMPEAEGARAFLEQFGFSEAVIHNGTVYLSGVIA